MLERFHLIEDGCAILLGRNRFTEAKVYRRGVDVYARVGAGFVKLGSQTITSDPRLSYLGVEGAGIAREGQRQPKWSPPE